MSIRITGMNSGMDTDSMVRELVNAYEKQGAKYTKAKTKTEWKQEAWSGLNTKIKSFYSKYASNMRFSDVYNKKSTTVSDSTKASIIASGSAVKGTQTLEVNDLAKSGYLTGASLKGNGYTSSTKLSDVLGSSISDGTKIKLNIGAGDGDNFDSASASVKEITINSDTTIGDFVKSLNAVDGITASYDEKNGRFFISSDESGLENNFNFEGNTGKANDVLNALGLVGEGAVKVQGSDARITLNGAEFTSSSNTFSINGLTITAKAKTADGEELSINTDVDADSIYNSIKDMLKEYNSLINELDKLYNTKAKKGIEPLTDEEKEAMTEKEIEKWEDSIKDSLLYGDSDIEKLTSAMKQSMLKTYDIDGKTYSLSSFGINTLNYFEAADNEKNALHIDGDSDDANSSGNVDKLKAMIAADPSTVQSFFTQLTSGLYDAMNKIQSESNNYTSYGSFFSDKKVKSDIETQEKQVKKWEDYVADVESKYYKQFTAMEKAMGNLNSQQTYLSQLFGG